MDGASALPILLLKLRELLKFKCFVVKAFVETECSNEKLGAM